MNAPKESGGRQMEYKEIMDRIVKELMEQSFRKQRAENPDFDRLITRHVALQDEMEQRMSVLGEETKKLFEDYHQIITEIEAYQERYLYMQGAKDCVMLLKFLGLL
jgi:hypothetical protein